jgi:hypothetical protein
MDKSPLPPGPSDREIPRLLIEKGWKQGSLFRASNVEMWCSEVTPGESQHSFTARGRSTPSDGRFVVVSQTCDLAAPLDKEPFVEAIACAPESDLGVRAGYARSFRWFEIDRGEGLIAHAMYRVAFDKRALLVLTPEPWPDTPERLRTFSRWLARRASRSAIPDLIVEAFVKPLGHVLSRLKKNNRDAYKAFNSVVEEIRLSLPESDAPPFEIGMVLLLDGEALSEAADDAIELVRSELENRLNGDEARLIGVEKQTRARMSVEFYFSTALVDLENLSYQGDEVSGAEPPPPA